LAKSLSGAVNPIYDFLAQEVLNNVSNDLEEFLVRISLLERVVPRRVVPLFSDRGDDAPSPAQADAWIEEADHLGLLTRTSQSSDSRQLHPLLREFLFRQLRSLHSEEAIKAMHLSVAQSLAESEPLVASRHYIEAGDHHAAMECLGRSVLLTMGSGQWGIASDLVDRLEGVAPNPVVAAIRARRLADQGRLSEANRLLDGLDLENEPANARAAVRYARLTVAWRSGDNVVMFGVLDEARDDAESPDDVTAIFSLYEDTVSLSSSGMTYVDLARRMQRMSERQVASGHLYHAAVACHNAAVSLTIAGHFQDAIAVANRALDFFEQVPGMEFEGYSTHATIGLCLYELGDESNGEAHLRTALSSASAHGDVHADCAYLFAKIGESSRATQLLMSASELQRDGLGDLPSSMTTTYARALMSVSGQPADSIAQLDALPKELPLDIGISLERQVLTALARYLDGDLDGAAQEATDTFDVATRTGARPTAARLSILLAIVRQDGEQLRSAIADASASGELAILCVADAIGRCLSLLPDPPAPLRESISKWRARWLPVLRRQLDGRSPNAFAAAALLDQYGELRDVGLLRAFAKTYGRSSKSSWALGRQLARRLSPLANVRDLGRTQVVLNGRAVDLGQVRRKPAALLMYLITRPGFTATREQAIEELWPDSEPSSAANSLNQSLYFIRREFDPWYEDDLSVDYIAFQGEVIWLDTSLVRVQSVEFVADARAAMRSRLKASEALAIMDAYTGQFSPEFEYEEWAMSWRARVHATYLQFASSAIEQLTGDADLETARDVALAALDRDGASEDIERKLIWLYWQLNARSAARTLHQHLATQERADGLQPTPLEDLVTGQLPE
jgi:DNA-binding SARP family transcriptional activator